MLSLFSELRDAQKLAGQKFHVIFFAENSYYFQYFEHLFKTLVQLHGCKVAYITSDKKDPVLADKRVAAFYLKHTLAGIFPRLQADVMIMTMPDLQNFIYKKSPTIKKYVYVFHALVSTHQQYRAHAFDHYDAIFCTGPQQEKEVRETENLYNLTPKDCVPYGYPLLGLLKEKVQVTSVAEKKILIAPTWYKEGILSTCILPLVNELLQQDHEIWIRPHPEFKKREKKVYDQLDAVAQEHLSVHLDITPSVYTHLLNADCLITDRSGIAMEYAFATNRPVLFIDTPLKIQNTDVEKFAIAPLENAYRHTLGISVLPNEMHRVNEGLQKLKNSAASYRTSISSSEKEIVYSSDNWRNGINYIKTHLRF